MKNLILNKSVLETLIIILIAVIIFVGLRLTIQTYIVYGPSMEPNYWEDEWIIVNKMAYKFGEAQRGDIIVFNPPISSTKPFIKRIIGLPGESVEIISGKVYIHASDGSAVTLQEPYINESFFTTYKSPTIAADKFFVMGDNRNDSSDSRNGWQVSRDQIIGKAWISIWPPSLWGKAPSYSQPMAAKSTTSK